MTIENPGMSYGHRSASALPLVEQKKRVQQVSKSIAGSTAKAFREAVAKELKKRA